MLENSTSHPKGRRWDRTMISIALQLWTRSPQGYKDMYETGTMILPSVRLLQRYKNIVDQGPGFKPEVIQWMVDTATEIKLPAEGYEGGLIFDEMSVQSDLQLDNKGGDWKMTGMVDLGDDCNNVDIIIANKKQCKLASHVLQMEFLGFTGFIFPFAFFASTQAQAYHLYSLFWEAVNQLRLRNFTVKFCMFDGAIANRIFLKLLFVGNPVDEHMLVTNIFDPTKKIVVCMEPKHVIKRIRNNVLKSGNHAYCTRTLMWKKLVIVWDHWRDAYQWDVGNNPEMMRIHHRLTSEHIEVSAPGKMRNHLAEQCLNADMLNLMVQYQSSLSDGSHLDSTIEFLKETSKLVKVFNDDRPIVYQDDERLEEVASAMKWFTDWQLFEKNPKKLMSRETAEDVCFMVSGFLSICDMRITDGLTVMPSRMNSDIVENFFCQQRGAHGDNTNPTLLQYSKNINTILLGRQSKSRSKKANSSLRGATLPYLSSKKQIRW